VGFVVFDRLLLSVHPPGCEILDAMLQRLSGEHGDSGGAPATGRPASRLPASASDHMLRMVSQMVDGYLALRRTLSRQLDHWQQELLDPRSRFRNWTALLAARNALHDLEQICEHQRAAVQEWIAARDDLPAAASEQHLLDRDPLHVRALTALTAIFLPLNLITGIFGMNFEFLSLSWGCCSGASATSNERGGPPPEGGISLPAKGSTGNA